MTAEQPEGWQWPSASRKAHYFRGGMSLCGKWMFLQREFDGGIDSPPSPHDCAECRRKVQRERLPGKMLN